VTNALFAGRLPVSGLARALERQAVICGRGRGEAVGQRPERSANEVHLQRIRNALRGKLGSFAPLARKGDPKEVRSEIINQLNRRCSRSLAWAASFASSLIAKRSK